MKATEGGAGLRWLAILSVIFMTGPFFGVVGTVIGMSMSFDVLSRDSGVASPDDLSTGIATALISTAIGLVAGAIGFVSSLILILATGYRELWYFWTMVGLSCLWLLGHWIAFISGLALLTVFFLKWGKFRTNKDVEQGAAPNP